MPLSDSTRESGAVLVTGATGFIGRPVLNRLRERAAMSGDGCDAIVGLARRATGELALDSFEICDLHDARAVEEAIRRWKPRACIHAAWEIDPARYRDDERNEQWVRSTLNLAESLARHGCEWLGVFGTCIEADRVEDATCRYAAAKTRLREELLASPIADRLCWWKLFQPYGPEEPAIRFVPSMLRTLAERRPFTVNAPADVRDFIHVSDIAECAIGCLHRRAVGVFELGTGEATSLEEAARIAATLLDADRLVRTRPITEAQRLKATRIVADPTALSACCGWQPRIELRNGLASLIGQARPSIARPTKGVHAA
jgi:nucleoside-diphosphate-sugar epimerase